MLSRTIYNIKHPKQLLRCESALEGIRGHYHDLAALAQQTQNIYLLPSIKGELRKFASHFHSCSSFLRSQWGQECAAIAAKKPYAAGKTARWYNKRIEKIRKHARETTYPEAWDGYERAIQSLQETAEFMDGVVDAFPEMDEESHFSFALSEKASFTDAKLVSTLLSYLFAPDNITKKGTIVTQDGDVIKTFVKALQHLPHNLQCDIAARAQVHYYLIDEKAAKMFAFVVKKW